MFEPIDIDRIVKLHAIKTKDWHDVEPSVVEQDFYNLVENNHLMNFTLWHEEDKARRDDKGFEYVYQAKRNIDRCNQSRNNFIEKMDQWIYENYQPPKEGCPANSETPGSMIDRLSILSLKDFHMHEQVVRKDADDAHRQKCQAKLIIIKNQIEQLELCLSELLEEVIAGTRTFRVYFQFKMYNDPKLNPQIYKNQPNVD